MRGRRRPVQEVTVNLTPLIDVVFLLLIFFMVSTTFTKETRLAVNLPEAAAGVTEVEQQEIVVGISREGAYTVAGRAVEGGTSEALQAAIEQRAAGDRTRPLVLFADANTPHAAVVLAMEAAGALGFSRLRIATRESDAS
ncbi:MAG: biopolymer transporter ExbD [Kistimonas sp.]|nr:biopolymer transporter ExbD [Kistimonas sp.]